LQDYHSSRNQKRASSFAGNAAANADDELKIHLKNEDYNNDGADEMVIMLKLVILIFITSKIDVLIVNLGEIETIM
jgi:hypothetical protein